MPVGLSPESTHAYLWEHAADAAAVVRTILDGDERGDGPLEGMSGAQIAAAVFIALGKDVGARVGRALDEEVMQVVARAVMETDAVAHSTGMHALEWVRQRVESGAYLNAGGPAYAHAPRGRRWAGVGRSHDARGASRERVVRFLLALEGPLRTRSPPL